MSSSNTKLDSLCDNLEGCKLDGTAETKISDEELFKQPPPKEDCPICFLRIPTLETGSKYKTCCGKTICSGCSYAPVYDNQGNEVKEKKCPFCRTPLPKANDEEQIKRLKKRVEMNDPIAIHNLGLKYYHGDTNDFPQDYDKALELHHQAAELRHANSYCCIGYAYDIGTEVEVDKKKARHYYELAAMMGDVIARHNLGYREENAGNIDRALRHYMIAVRGGFAQSLETIKVLYLDGLATKDDYTKALRLYQEYLGEIKSPQRDKAAAAHERYRYY